MLQQSITKFNLTTIHSTIDIYRCRAMIIYPAPTNDACLTESPLATLDDPVRIPVRIESRDRS